MEEYNGFKGAFKVVGQATCDDHDTVYDLYDTPGGVTGMCNECFKQQQESENKTLVEKAMKNHEEGYRRFVMSFERVTGDLQDATVNSYQPKHETQAKAKQAVVRFVEDFERDGTTRSLVLSGSPGLGKSHLSYATAKAFRAKGLSALYVKSTDLLDHIKNTYSNEARTTEEQIYKMIENLDLLILDDIGSEYIKVNESGHESWASDVLYKVLDSRLNQPTICTTNYGEIELEKKYGHNGPRITSRMMDNTEAIRLQGEDRRRKARF